MNKLGWNFDNSYARLPGSFYTIQEPTPVRSPELVLINKSLAERLGLDDEKLKSDDGVAVLAGNRVPDSAMPIAQAYAGHQFGHFTMLGDGRALLIGEQISPDGKRFDIQLKGSGRTPYSRGGDGRAALGPMLREYLISEAMEYLGIPTTRSLAVVKTGETVIRETRLPGAILTRVAESHIRVGTFQCISKWGSLEDLKTLADYTIQRHYPDAAKEENPYLSLLREVIGRQAALIAKWQLVGFVHGVMNTDNMSISGETIDYGPCAFMDTYDPATVFSSIDTNGRYAYVNQPRIAVWNLTRFAETLLPLLDDDKQLAIQIAQNTVSGFNEQYLNFWLNGMRGKLGLFNEEQLDHRLIENLLKLMEKYKADYTNTFISLAFEKFDDSHLFQSKEFKEWHDQWQKRLDRQSEPGKSIQQRMKQSNPALIPRNHRVEESLEAAVKHGDYYRLNKFLDLLSNPYEHRPEQEEYSALPETTTCSYRTFCGT